MDRKLRAYLEEVDRYLRYMPVYEKMDILKSIEGEMTSLTQKENLDAGQVIERLGDARVLARAYLGRYISQNHRFSWRKLEMMLVFISLADLFFLPMGCLFATALIVIGVIVPLVGILQFVSYLNGVDVSIVVIQFGSAKVSPPLLLATTLVMGFLMLRGGFKLWKLNLRYIRTVSLLKGRSGKRKRALDLYNIDEA